MAQITPNPTAEALLVSTTHTEIARHVRGAFKVTWASRDDLLRAAFDSCASPEVVNVLLSLPEGYYRDPDDVCSHLPDVPHDGSSDTRSA
ncbi:MAG TPA: DUF2795 domain-containing protein [Nocardioidaceae bacterium]